MNIREKIENRLGGYFDSPKDWAIKEFDGKLYAYFPGLEKAVLEEPAYYSFLVVDNNGMVEKDRYKIFLNISV